MKWILADERSLVFLSPRLSASAVYFYYPSQPIKYPNCLRNLVSVSCPLLYPALLIRFKILIIKFWGTSEVKDLKRISWLAILLLVVLRISIGWQFLYEGMWKYDQMDTPKPWSAEGYLKKPPRRSFQQIPRFLVSSTPCRKVSIWNDTQTRLSLMQREKSSKWWSRFFLVKKLPSRKWLTLFQRAIKKFLTERKPS